jgi:hypothetical protein
MTDYNKAVSRLEHILDSMDAVLLEAIRKQKQGVVRSDKNFDSYMANLAKVSSLLQLRAYYKEKAADANI